MSTPITASNPAALPQPGRFSLDRLWNSPSRPLAMGVAVLASLVFIALLSVFLHGRAAMLLLDKPSLHFPYPFTIQNMMHVVFFIGLAELYVRWRNGVREEKFLDEHYLPEDDHTVLMSDELGAIRKQVAKKFSKDHGILPALINLAILQFQSSNSVEQVASVTNQQLELISHRVDMRYGLVRFIAWIIPTLGFIGTVFSLGASLYEAGDPNKTFDPKEVAKTLGIGFDCTMVALMESAVLVFILHLVQEKEESALNHAGDYTLNNLINRLYTGK